MISIPGINADADVDRLKGYIHREHIRVKPMLFIKLNCLQYGLEYGYPVFTCNVIVNFGVYEFS